MAGERRVVASRRIENRQTSGSPVRRSDRIASKAPIEYAAYFSATPERGRQQLKWRDSSVTPKTKKQEAKKKTNSSRTVPPSAASPRSSVCSKNGRLPTMKKTCSSRRLVLTSTPSLTTNQLLVTGPIIAVKNYEIANERFDEFGSLLDDTRLPSHWERIRAASSSLLRALDAPGCAPAGDADLLLLLNDVTPDGGSLSSALSAAGTSQSSSRRLSRIGKNGEWKREERADDIVISESESEAESAVAELSFENMHATALKRQATPAFRRWQARGRQEVSPLRVHSFHRVAPSPPRCRLPSLTASSLPGSLQQEMDERAESLAASQYLPPTLRSALNAYSPTSSGYASLINSPLHD